LESLRVLASPVYRPVIDATAYVASPAPHDQPASCPDLSDEWPSEERSESQGRSLRTSQKRAP